MDPSAEGERAVWFLVASDGEGSPYYALVNAQGRYAPGSVADDPLSGELAALGFDGVIDAVLAAVP